MTASPSGYVRIHSFQSSSPCRPRRRTSAHRGSFPGPRRQLLPVEGSGYHCSKHVNNQTMKQVKKRNNKIAKVFELGYFYSAVFRLAILLKCVNNTFFVTCHPNVYAVFFLLAKGHLNVNITFDYISVL